MQSQLSDAVIRMHGPLNLRLWDRLVIAVGCGFLALGAVLHLVHDTTPALVAATGGTLVLAQASRERRRHRNAVWSLAEDDDDPIEALALYEYLYALCFRDLLVVARWRTQREAAGLPALVDDPDAPAQVRAIWDHLRGNLREE